MAAVYTPMKSGGMELDLTRIPPYAELLARINVTNLMPAGSNGESLSLSVTERKALAEAWAKEGPARGLKVYIHVGAESLIDAIELAKHAASLPGVTGLVSMTPVYYKPSVQTLHDWLAAVAASAPKLPFWYYHFPDGTGVLPGKAHALLELVDQTGRIPNFMGIKFTDYNLLDFQRCLQVANGKYNMLFGRDEEGLAAIMLGGDSVVSSTIQYSATLRDVVRLHEKGDWAGAEAAQRRNAQLCSHFGAFDPSVDVQKNIMTMVGLDVGPSRLPKTDMTHQDFTKLQADLRSAGLIDTPPGDRLAVHLTPQVV